MASKDCRFTIGYTYYNEPHLLEEQMKLWERYPHQIQIILVDDGSELFPAYDIVKDINYPNFQLWRVEKDLGFNSHGCRNLIAHVAESDNILFMDIDSQISPENIAFLKKCAFSKEKLYKFNLYNSCTYRTEDFPGHPNIFLINKETFWEAGGYDESFTGWHKGDREFMRRLDQYTELAKLSPSLGVTVVRGGRRIVVDTSVDKTTYDDNNMVIKTPALTPSDAELVGKVTTKINFPYSRLL